MKFDEFQEKIVEGLQEIYSDGAEIEPCVALKNNGSKYNGVNIFLKGSGNRTCPIIDLDRLYKLFEDGTLNIGECVRDIYSIRTALNSPEDVEQFAENTSAWEHVKDDIYPALLSTEENSELLEKLVSMPMLDLSIVYIIRGEISGNTVSIKVSKGLLERYGISSEQLHMQAMENMKKDGYEFLNMISMLKSNGVKIAEEDDSPAADMYVLTNAAKSYGAAGILNKELLQEFAGGRDFFILPSSIHDVIFVPVDGEWNQDFYDGMVSEVNRSEVSVEEKLADHSYYYDAASSEIRMCA